jgi:hypothetical protein
MQDSKASAGVRLKATPAVLEYLLKLRELRNVEQRLTALEMTSKSKRLAELKHRLAATHKQVTDAQAAALRESVARREQPGYVLTAEGQAIEWRWYEVVQSTVPKPQWVTHDLRAWAIGWDKAVRKHG